MPYEARNECGEIRLGMAASFASRRIMSAAVDRVRQAAVESTQQRFGCGYGAGERGEVVRLDAPRHEVTAQVALDPPGHVRPPSEDDEVIDRAVVVQSLTGMPVTLLTYDTGQAMLGRQAGLHVRKQNKPKDEEAGG